MSDLPSPSIRIESTNVIFEMAATGKTRKLPAKYGTIRDEGGVVLPKCDVFFGPFRVTRKKVEMSRSHRRYFGSDYEGSLATLPKIPREGWKVIGKVSKIFYLRRGKYAPGGFHHTFDASHQPTLSKNGKFLKLSLGAGCIVDARGYVFP